MRPRHRRRVLLRAVVGFLAAISLLAVSVASADASGSTYRIGSGVSATKSPARKASPSPSPTSTTATPTGTASPTPSPTGSSTGASRPSNCGGTTLTKPDGSAWTCTFDDEFSDSSLDSTKWSVQVTDGSGYTAGGACYVDTTDNVAVSAGTLKLTARKESAPFTCHRPSGDFTTRYTSGMVSGYNKFSQTYGMFEVRAKVPSTTIPGLQETLWLWPVNQIKYGLWPGSGEIDFAEFYSQYQGWNVPYLHYAIDPSTSNWTTNTNVYTAWPAPYNQPGMACSFKATDFNAYTVVWQPGRITLQVNHQNCIVDNYSASNVTGAAPFDQPFFLALTQALGVGSNAYVDGSTPLPATTEVDYVRIWK